MKMAWEGEDLVVVEEVGGSEERDGKSLAWSMVRDKEVLLVTDRLQQPREGREGPTERVASARERGGNSISFFSLSSRP